MEISKTSRGFLRLWLYISVPVTACDITGWWGCAGTLQIYIESLAATGNKGLRAFILKKSPWVLANQQQVELSNLCSPLKGYKKVRGTANLLVWPRRATNFNKVNYNQGSDFVAGWHRWLCMQCRSRCNADPGLGPLRSQEKTSPPFCSPKANACFIEGTVFWRCFAQSS